MQSSWAQQPRVNDITWSVAAELPAGKTQAVQPGLAGVFAGTHQNVLLIAGGANFPEGMPWQGGNKKYHTDVFVLYPAADGRYAWGGNTFSLPLAVAYGASVSTPGGVFCAGGETKNGYTDKVFLMKWNPVSKAAETFSLPSLPIATANAGASLINTTVYVAGGETVQGVTSSVWALNLAAASPVWEAMPPLPAPRSHVQMVAQSNGEESCLYVIGGRRATTSGISERSSGTWCFIPGQGKWTTGSPISDGHQQLYWSAGTAIACGATYIILAGGDDGRLFRNIEAYNVRLKAAVGESERLAIQQEKLQLLNNHPGFNRSVLLYNTATDTWTKLGEMPFPAQVTTVAVKWNGDIFIPSGEVRPGVRITQVIKGVIDKPAFFSKWDYALLIAYFLLMLGIGIWTSMKQHSTLDYFKGGQKIPGWATGLSIFGAKLSAITFIGIPAKTYATDWTYFFLLMTIIMAMPFVIRYFIPFYRKLSVTSSYEYLEKRFNYVVRGISGFMYILLQLGRMGIVILLPSIALSVVTGIEVRTSIIVMGLVSLFYTVLGGIEAVIWTEVVQVIILLTGAILALILIPMHLISGPVGMSQTLQHYNKLKLFDLRFDFTSSSFWVVLIGGFSLNLIQYGCDQTVVQRYLTTTDEKTAVKSLRLGAWLTLPSTIIFFAIGTLLFLFYRDHPAEVNIALNNQDTIFPWYIVTQLPKGIAGLVITAIFAAAMGSLNGSVNGVATVVVNDFFRRFMPLRPDKFYLRAARAVTLAVGLFGTLIAWLMASWGATSLWDEFNLILGLFTGSVGGLFILGIFTRRANGPGAVIGFVCSALVQFILMQYTHMYLLMYAFTGLVACFVTGYLASLFFSRPSSLEGLTIYKK
ncbi:sodium/solute symporter [Chitinophaga sp. Ak27]|nr:sodium/solute symporter [Chitinophaga sp. Ak27]